MARAPSPLVKGFVRLALVAGAVGALAAPAGATSVSAPTPSVALVKVQGVIDPAQVAYVEGAIRDAEAKGSTVILQIDSRGAYGMYGDEGLRLGEFVRSASVPVVAWIGPSGARAAGASLFPVYASSLVVMAPGAGIGPAEPFDLGGSVQPQDEAATAARLVAIGTQTGASPSGVERLLRGPAEPAGTALTSGAVRVVAADVPDLLARIDGRSVTFRFHRVTRLATLNRPDRPVDVSFHEIGIWRRILHGVSTPGAVYVLLILGVFGVAFEITQPGFGVAGVGGAGVVALAGYGLSVIPVHWLGIALLLGGMVLMGSDVMIRRVAVLTALGTVAVAVGSVLAWHGVAPPIRVSLWLIGPATVATFLFFGFVLTVALRSREQVRRAQVGLVGLVGEARSDLNPEGGVYVKGTLWRARSNDGPIQAGRKVRVRAIDGLILQVEEEPGT
jgi:membrane-bound serine protease (ClpP class)